VTPTIQRLAAGVAWTATGLLLAACAESTLPHDEPVGRPAALSVAAASDLRYALDDVVAAFRAEHPAIDVAVSYGSSGNFYAQLVNGAPFDLYLSADIAYAKRLADQGVAQPDSLFTYADGRLVVWVPSSSELDVAGRGLEALTDAAVVRVAIANPEHAPYGRAAEAALRSAGVYETVKPKLVLGENVSQALQFVESGAAQAGVVALSLVLAPPVAAAGRYAVLPRDVHPRLEQGGVIMKHASGAQAAQLFRSFMLGADGRAVLDRYGFAVPR
jgi:molybdate transport system substrate-binding protein